MSHQDIRDAVAVRQLLRAIEQLLIDALRLGAVLVLLRLIAIAPGYAP